jgi:hypothetical protein
MYVCMYHTYITRTCVCIHVLGVCIHILGVCIHISGVCIHISGVCIHILGVCIHILGLSKGPKYSYYQRQNTSQTAVYFNLDVVTHRYTNILIHNAVRSRSSGAATPVGNWREIARSVRPFTTAKAHNRCCCHVRLMYGGSRRLRCFFICLWSLYTVFGMI